MGKDTCLGSLIPGFVPYTPQWKERTDSFECMVAC